MVEGFHYLPWIVDNAMEFTVYIGLNREWIAVSVTLAITVSYEKVP